MKALTIRQPWATLIALGVKTIETRSWRAPQALIGQTIAIHAGNHRPKDVYQNAHYGPFDFPQIFAPLYDYGKCVDPQESSDGEWWRYRWAGPLGAIVATATLADCVPMVADCGAADVVHLAIEPARLCRNWTTTGVSDQLPFGDFQPGRWAWLLTDVKPTTEHCPACLIHPAFQHSPLVSARDCRLCGGTGTCPPIPAKGRQGLWEWQP